MKNKDLWIELDRLASGHVISWNWLKGHAGHTENERCDLLARGAIAELRKKFTREQLSAALNDFKATRANEEIARSAAQVSLFS